MILTSVKKMLSAMNMPDHGCPTEQLQMVEVARFPVTWVGKASVAHECLGV